MAVGATVSWLHHGDGREERAENPEHGPQDAWPHRHVSGNDDEKDKAEIGDGQVDAIAPVAQNVVASV